MAMDSQKETDEVYEFGGITFLADKEFMKKATPVKVDFGITGFLIDSNIDFGPSSGACSSCGTGGKTSCGS